MNAPVAWPLVIYYDASCPLCARELGTLKAFDRGARLLLIDCSPLDFDDAHVAEAGLSRHELMRAIHARDSAGRWYRAIDVFALAYEAGGLAGVAGAFRSPRWRPIWDWLYPRIADNRMWLSQLGLTRLYGRTIEFAARRAARRASTCHDGKCAAP